MGLSTLDCVMLACGVIVKFFFSNELSWCCVQGGCHGCFK